MAEGRLVRSVVEVLDDAAVVIGIDTPLGGTTPGDRRADQAARDFLPGKKSTIFPAPPLEALRAETYREACDIAHELSGKRIPKQAWNLREKMLDAHRCWCRDPERLREVHPECSFTAMAGEPLLSKKRSWPGVRARLAQLRAHGIDLLDEGCDLHVATDDIVDAAAVAWSAHRIALGTAGCLPDPPDRDADGRAVAIWY